MLLTVYWVAQVQDYLEGELQNGDSAGDDDDYSDTDDPPALVVEERPDTTDQVSASLHSIGTI